MNNINRKDAYHNIQGRKPGKATRDLHYTRMTFSGRQDFKLKLTNAERNILRQIEAFNRQHKENNSKKSKANNHKYKTTFIMRLIIFAKRLLSGTRVALFLLVWLLAACHQPNVPFKETPVYIPYGNEAQQVSVVVIEDCEYLLIGVGYAQVFSHKGNCKNPIHIYNNKVK